MATIPESNPVACEATTQTGQPCRRNAADGSGRCTQHALAHDSSGRDDAVAVSVSAPDPNPNLNATSTSTSGPATNTSNGAPLPREAPDYNRLVLNEIMSMKVQIGAMVQRLDTITNMYLARQGDGRTGSLAQQAALALARPTVPHQATPSQAAAYPTPAGQEPLPTLAQETNTTDSELFALQSLQQHTMNGYQGPSENNNNDNNDDDDDMDLGVGSPYALAPVTAYPTLAAAQEAAQSQAIANGYRLVVKQFRPSKENATSCSYACHKYRKYVKRSAFVDTDPSKQRKRSSHMTQCPFKIGIQLKHNGWVVYEPKHGHNHPPEPGIMLRSEKRALLSERAEEIMRLSSMGRKPRDILAILIADNPSSSIRFLTRYDITNFLSSRAKS